MRRVRVLYVDSQVEERIRQNVEINRLRNNIKELRVFLVLMMRSTLYEALALRARRLKVYDSSGVSS